MSMPNTLSTPSAHAAEIPARIIGTFGKTATLGTWRKRWHRMYLAN